MPDEHVPVLIAGAGPTGLVTALLLARHGLGSLVVERHTDAYPLPRAVHLDDETFRILQAAGVADGFAAISRPMLGLRLVDGTLAPLAEFRRDRAEGDHGHPEANMFDQPDLERVLRDAVATQPLIRLCGGTELVDIDIAEPVAVTLRDVASGQERTVRTQVLLGCDGANSTVRSAVGAVLDDLHFEERWFVVDVRCGKPLAGWDGVHQICDPARPATFMQVGPERYRWEFRLDPDEADDALAAPAELARLLAPWTADVDPAEVQLLRHTAYTFKARVADRWRRGRVFLLGDAAHLTPPFIGQGLGSGLRDAYNLAWKVALVVGEGADERLLDDYQPERGPHARRTVRLAVMVGWAMNAGGTRAAVVRRLALGAVGRIPAASDAALRTSRHRLPRGPLVRTPRGPRHGLVGLTCPQPWVTVDGDRKRLDDVLGAGFAVLSRGPLDSALTALAARLGARVVRLDPGPGHVADDGVLTGWLEDGRAGVVLLRPDRVVLDAAPFRPGGAQGLPIAARSGGWRALLGLSPTTPLTPSPTDPTTQ